MWPQAMIQRALVSFFPQLIAGPIVHHREIVPQCAADIPFEQGDIQFLHNHVILHSRNAFEDWPEPARKRHLYRLWLAAGKDSRPVPKAVRQSFSGIRVAGYAPKVVIDPEEADEAVA